MDADTEELYMKATLSPSIDFSSSDSILASPSLVSGIKKSHCVLIDTRPLSRACIWKTCNIPQTDEEWTDFYTSSRTMDTMSLDTARMNLPPMSLKGVFPKSMFSLARST